MICVKSFKVVYILLYSKNRHQDFSCSNKEAMCNMFISESDCVCHESNLS